MPTAQRTALCKDGRYGLYHCLHKYWIGNERGPFRYNDWDLVRAAATVFNEMNQCGYAVQAKPYAEKKLKNVGTITVKFDAVAAIKRIEARIL